MPLQRSKNQGELCSEQIKLNDEVTEKGLYSLLVTLLGEDLWFYPFFPLWFP